MRAESLNKTLRKCVKGGGSFTAGTDRDRMVGESSSALTSSPERQAEPYRPMALMAREIRAVGYRSLRAIRFPVGNLSVFVGANGAGKTNLYRALQLLQSSAAGKLSQELAAEGGMESALWAGKRRRQ